MPSNAKIKPLNKNERKSTLAEFKDYCAAEKEGRVNSGGEFDSGKYDRAVDIALQKLAKLEKEGWG